VIDVTSLVAYHTGASIEAEERGLGSELAHEFRPPPTHLLDVLTTADLAVGPDGLPRSRRTRAATCAEASGCCSTRSSSRRGSHGGGFGPDEGRPAPGRGIREDGFALPWRAGLRGVVLAPGRCRVNDAEVDRVTAPGGPDCYGVVVGLGVGVVGGAMHAATCIEIGEVDPEGIACTWITCCAYPAGHAGAARGA
jgi:hypothetical protein